MNAAHQKIMKNKQIDYLLLVILLCSSVFIAAGNVETQYLPRFTDKVPNVTQTVGRDALITCNVEQLKGYKVAWVQVDTQTILTIHKQVITRNPRISLLHDDHKSWHLQIKNVQESDRGWYMCQVNTDPMRSRQGYLDVQVPPNIIDKESSGDFTVREGEDVLLRCKAKGHPTPTIQWRREDDKKIILQDGKEVPPVAWVPQQLEGAYVGMALTIECHTEAFPKSINYWTKEEGEMIITGDHYESIIAESSYTTFMKLQIKSIRSEDFGTFRCIAKNSLGETDGVIKVYEVEPPKLFHPNLNPEEEEETIPDEETWDGTTPTSLNPKKGRNKFDSSHSLGVNEIPNGRRHSKRPQYSNSKGTSFKSEHGPFSFLPGQGCPVHSIRAPLWTWVVLAIVMLMA